MPLLPFLLLPVLAQTTYEHRVVVPTTSLDQERDIEDSLTRNVNQLAKLGFEVGAITGGNGLLFDRLLLRKPYTPGLVDHGGNIFVIMHRPTGQPAPIREYRFLHTRTPLGVEEKLATYARDGFRLTVTATEGDYFHAAFERSTDATPIEYRVFRNAQRRPWDTQMLATPDLQSRLRRVFPITLDSALVELGPPATTPAEFAWESEAPHQRARLQSKLNSRASAGFRVQLVRLRGNILDIALLKPAGATTPAPALTLEDGPWGGPCSRGTIAGADVWTDGDVYCVAEDPKGPVTNRGFDLIVAPESAMDGQLSFGRPSCDIASRLRSTRPAAIRIARAIQLQREIQRRIEPGYRITRSFAAIKSPSDQRLVFFSSRLPAPALTGTPAPQSPPQDLTQDLDALGQQLLATRERDLNASLATELSSLRIEAWAEINEVRANNHVLLLGCSRNRLDRDRAESILRSLLARTPYSTFRIRNEITIDLLP